MQRNVAKRPAFDQSRNLRGEGQLVAFKQMANMIRGKTSRFAVGTVLGLLLGGALAAGALLIAYRDPTPELTQAAFEAAERQWSERGPRSYDMDLAIEGNRPGTVHVEVRGGEVVHMMRDGVEPKQRRTWGVWTVPGQFETIGLELDKADNPTEGFEAPPGARMVQRARFDPQYGYPARYHRIILGSNLELDWRVTRFVPRDDPPEINLDGADAERGK
jgi:hypothetical protein